MSYVYLLEASRDVHRPDIPSRGVLPGYAAKLGLLQSPIVLETVVQSCLSILRQAEFSTKNSTCRHLPNG
jgi:hypothetical protein